MNSNLLVIRMNIVDMRNSAESQVPILFYPNQWLDYH